MNLGERIKSLRKSKGLTQAELSEQCGIAIRTIQRIENNEVKPSLFSQRALIKALDADLDFFSPESVISNQIPKPQTPKKMVQFLSSLNPYKIQILSILAFCTLAISAYFSLSSRIQDQFQAADDVFEVATINCGSDTECDIHVTKKDKRGNILWQQTFGGTSYDKASAIVSIPDQGCVVLGSMSSFGKGNYDILLLKIDNDGALEWKQTYGGFFNEYGNKIQYMASGAVFSIEGTQQTCSTPNVSNDCRDEKWVFLVDEKGELAS